MKINFKILISCVTGLFLFIAAQSPTPIQKVKCMIQLINYSGEGAYVVVSVLDQEGTYVQTLFVQGKDNEWYHDIPEWWKFYGKRRLPLDGITGATVGGGERTIFALDIPQKYIDANYQIRFETAVEDQEYHASDVQFDLSSENINGKKEGTGFIRYVRLMSQN